MYVFRWLFFGIFDKNERGIGIPFCLTNTISNKYF